MLSGPCAHQPGLRPHMNAILIAMALEQLDKMLVNGLAYLCPVLSNKIADLHPLKHEASGALGITAGAAHALLTCPGIESDLAETRALEKVDHIVLLAEREWSRRARLRRE